jgi:hypothetical protein
MLLPHDLPAPLCGHAEHFLLDDVGCDMSLPTVHRACALWFGVRANHQRPPRSSRSDNSLSVMMGDVGSTRDLQNDRIVAMMRVILVALPWAEGAMPPGASAKDFCSIIMSIQLARHSLSVCFLMISVNFWHHPQK